MRDKNSNLVANRLVKAFLKNKIINPISSKYTKKLLNADKFRKLCESKIKKPIIGFKAGGTGIPVIKKLKEKEPFYASVYKHNVLKNNKSVKNLENHQAKIEIRGNPNNDSCTLVWTVIVSPKELEPFIEQSMLGCLGAINELLTAK